MAGVVEETSRVDEKREKRRDAMERFSSRETERREARVERSSMCRDRESGDWVGRREGRERRSCSDAGEMVCVVSSAHYSGAPSALRLRFNASQTIQVDREVI